MKKIIYSLVIMIAAGSLFTSCIDQVEPVGILDMRSAKAEYIRALKELRAADAEFRRAEAQLKLADARYRDAETAWMNAQTEYQNLLNELRALQNEKEAMENELRAAQIADEIARLEMAMEEDAKQHEIRMLDLEKGVAEAEEALRVALRNIALHSQDLTDDEKKAVAEAVALYEGVFEVYQKQIVKVKEAQAKVDELKDTKARFTDTVWNGAKLVNYVDYYNAQIEKEQKNIEKYQAVLDALPESDAGVDAWKNALDEYQNNIDQLRQAQAQLAYDKKAYEIAKINEGVEAFNNEILLWIKDNWNEKSGVYTEPSALTKAEKAFVALGEPKAEDYLALADTIDFPKLKDYGDKTFNAFRSMLYRYFSIISPAGWDYNINVIKWDSKAQRYVLIADQSMRDFILGTEMSTYDSQKYTFVNKDNDELTYDAKWGYGLKGAISVLDRKRVTEEADPQNYQDSVDKYKGIWKADRDSLAAVFGYYKGWKDLKDADKKKVDNNVVYGTTKGYLTKYQPYVDALAKLKTAKDNYDKAVEDIAAEKAELFASIKNLYEQLGEIDGDTEINKADSVAILAGIERYAKARDQYLTDKRDNYPAGKNPHFFYFASKLDDGQPVVDSVNFNVIASQSTFKPSVYEYKTDNTKPTIANREDKGVYKALMNILNQLFPGKNMGDGIDAATKIDIAIATNLTSSTEIIDGAYSKKDTPVSYMVDSWSDPKNLTSPAGYTKNASTTALDNAKDNLKAAVAAYEDLYKRYWGVSSYPGVDNEVDPECYLEETFIDPFCIATFDSSDYLMYTSGLNVVFNGIGITRETIFGEGHDYAYGSANQSDFFNYMYWLDKIGTIDIETLNALKEWVKAVEDAFDADLLPSEEKLDEAKEYYNALVAKGNAYDKYVAAKKEFTGTRKVGSKTVINDVFCKTPWTKGDPMKITKVEDLFNVNILGRIDGWREDLGGTQLENAKKIFGEDLPSIYQGWQDKDAEYAQDILDMDDLKTLAEKVYMAAAKIAGYEDFAASMMTSYADIAELKQLMDSYYEYLIETYEGKIEKAKKNIETYRHKIATFKSGVPAIDIEIADAEADLKIEQHRLAALEQALELAKANMEKVLEYIQTVDANFVLPEIGGTAPVSEIIALLKSVGYSIPGIK